MSWNTKDLELWDDKICKLASTYDLDWFDINYEICDYYEMMGHMSYHGMPSHYNHWSYGKSFEQTRQLYNLGATGLPYELIINSDPSIAYLMKQNDLYLQILIMAHCVGHSDFFKNNRCFKETDPQNIVAKFRNARNRIQKYSEDPHIGVDLVEEFINCLHSIRFQTARHPIPRLSKEKIRSKLIAKYNNEKSQNLVKKISLKKLEGRLLKEDHDLLSFFLEYGTKFEDWQLDIINIVKEDSAYFIPQVKTKILNEGWASFWHYKILHELDLPQEFHLPFLKMHNAVVRPHIGGINPYHVGFYLFKKIEKEHGLDECFLIREAHDDESAIRMYLDENDFRELNLFTYSKTKNGDTFIDEVSDHDDWKEVRNSLLRNTGINSIPRIYVHDIKDDNSLVLKHDHDGRDLDLEYADKVIENVRNIWEDGASLFTIIEDDIWEI
jgi:stage V sporulation protein R